MATVLSCIMPIYNAAEYLNEAVESVLSQSWPYFELILIDDGSTDGSEAICDEWNRTDDRVRVIHQTNQGAAAARNTGVSVSEGRIVCFVDADDKLLPGAFAAIVPAFDNRSRDLVSFGMDLRDENAPQHAAHPAFCCDDLSEFWPHFLDYYQSGLFPSLCNKAYRGDLVREMAFDTRCRTGEDLDFNLNYWSKVHSFEHIDRQLYEYTLRPDSLTRNPVTDRMEVSRAVLHKLKAFLHEHGQENLYPLLVAARLPWDAAAFFDLLLDPERPFSADQRRQGLEKLFGDTLWHTALLTELSKRSGRCAKMQRMAATQKSPRLALFSLRFAKKK